MADELKHDLTALGTTLQRTDWEDVDNHRFDSQAQGDMLIATSVTQLSRLGITNDRILVSSGGLFSWANTLPAFTLGGTITGGNQTINNLGHVGAGDTLADANLVFYIDEDHTNPVASSYGAYVTRGGIETGGANANRLAGGLFNVSIEAANTQNWTGDVAGLFATARLIEPTAGAYTVSTLEAIHTYMIVEASTTATEAYGLHITDPAGAGTVTTNYGIYIDAMTKGATDWAIYSAGGKSRFLGALWLSDDIGVQFGNYPDVELKYHTYDANARVFLGYLNVSGDAANNKPVFLWGDESLAVLDLGTVGIDFSAVTEPAIAVANAAADAYVSLDAGDVNGTEHGLYFHPAGDEDVTILKIGVAGTPTVKWNEAADKLDFSHSIVFSASVDSALVADQVSLGGFDIAPGQRSLAISQENPVVNAAAGASDNYLPVRINGATFKLLLHS